MKTSPIGTGLAALCVFWGPTATAFLIEYVVERGNGQRWSGLETLLTLPMLFGVVAGAGLGVFAVIDCASRCKAVASTALVLVLGFLFGAANLVALWLAHLWFVINVMCWDSL
jgi:hypothetical protein